MYLAKVQWRGRCCWKWRRQGGELNRKEERVVEQTHRKCGEENNITSCGCFGDCFSSAESHWQKRSVMLCFLLLFFSLPFSSLPFPFHISSTRLLFYLWFWWLCNLRICTLTWQNYTQKNTMMTLYFTSLRSKASFMRHCHVLHHHFSGQHHESGTKRKIVVIFIGYRNGCKRQLD